MDSHSYCAVHPMIDFKVLKAAQENETLTDKIQKVLSFNIGRNGCPMTSLRIRNKSVKYYGITTLYIKQVLRVVLKAFKVLAWLSVVSFCSYLIGCFCYNKVPCKCVHSSQICKVTKWCGVGQLASHPDDFGIYGYFITVDKCCKGHDLCPHFIRQNETRFNLKNPVPYTISDCTCDDSFRACLKETIKEAAYPDRILALMVKIYFFNMIKMPCFQINHDNLQNDAPHETTTEKKVAVMKPGKVFDILGWLTEST